MINYVGDKLKELLDKSNKSINDLARATNIASNHWARIITGSTRISVDLAIRLGKVFPENKLTNTSPIGYWLWCQHQSDIDNALLKENELIYRDIKPL